MKIKNERRKSGRRLVLRYSLQLTQPSVGICSAASISKDRSNLGLILRSWASSKDFYHSVLGHVFEHRYTNQRLMLRNLKSKDLLVVSQLQEACASTGFYVCLGNIERVVEGAYFDEHVEYGETHEMTDEFSDTIYLKHVVEIDGSKTFFVKEKIFEENNILQDDPFDNATVDEEEADEENGKLTYKFRKSVSRSLESRTVLTLLDDPHNASK